MMPQGITKRKAFGSLSGNRPIITNKPTKAAVSTGIGSKSAPKYFVYSDDDESSVAQTDISSITSCEVPKMTRKGRSNNKEKENMNPNTKQKKRKSISQKCNSNNTKKNDGVKKTKSTSSKKVPNAQKVDKAKASKNRWKPSLSVVAEASEAESVTLSLNENGSVTTVDLDKTVDDLIEISEQNQALDPYENVETKDFLDKMDISVDDEPSAEADLSNEIETSSNPDTGMNNSSMENSNENKLPKGWIVKYSKSKGGKPYYVNFETKMKTWNRPSNTESETKKISKSKTRVASNKTKNQWSTYVKFTASKQSTRILKAPLCSLQFLDELMKKADVSGKKLVGLAARRKKLRLRR